MKRSVSFLVVCLALGVASAASAQSTDPAQPPACEHHRGGGQGRGGPEARVDFMIHALALDEHQTQLVHEIMQSTHGERERIRALPRGSAEQIAARQALEESVHTQIDAVLDDTQRAQLARMRAWREAHRGQWAGHRGAGRGHGGPSAPPAGI